ncbi:DUF935 domain-containing protein [Oceaniglobus trochenteri]|uniref:DUF935 domain-containing protein n=1 Tax=Oceaniglobus trochenteri TaxID=2763260 RepID=UPI001CFF695D|nr:DUF935 domain-containing protein [Oceaniglobus trochenteri]
MARIPHVLDRFGRPVQRSVLTREVAAATFGGVRSPISGTPADGLNPVRLANILRAADRGDPVQYLELAEVIEERDPHYLGVLGTRRRSVSQIDITVDAASDAPQDVKIADMVRDWLKRDELTDEIFDMLDAIGKGYSFTEIIWDTSSGQWEPQRLEWRDPRWFRFAHHDLATPMKIDENGQDVPLDPFKFIFTTIKAKSGLALRSGLARVAAWGWMFKAYTQRDWAIFTQTYGQPLRLGKYGAGSSEKDRDTLFAAVANIAGDCAATIPEGMEIEFIEAKNVGSASGLYKERSDWLDQQISKAVLGQTATTDAVTGGLGSGKEHREVQEDIERADAKALSAILNRDLIRPWVDLEFGAQTRYPRLKIARPEAEDLKAAAEALGILVPLGLRVSMSEVRDKYGWSDPKPKDEILSVQPQTAPPGAGDGAMSDATGPESAVKYPFNTLGARAGVTAPQMAEAHPTGAPGEFDPVSVLTGRLEREARPAMGEMIGRIEAMLEAAQSFDEFRDMLLNGYPDLDASALASILANAMMAADLGGRALVAADDA